MTISFKDALAEYKAYISLQNPKADNTIISYYHDLEEYLDWLKQNKHYQSLEEIQKEDLNMFIEAQMKVKTKRSVARVATSIRNFSRYFAAEYDLPDISSELKVKTNNDHLPVYLNDQEIQAIMDSFTDQPKDLFEHSILELLYNSGLRVHECISLTLNQVYLEQQFIRVKGKGDKERIVPFGHKCLVILERYLTEIRPLWLKNQGSPLLFINPQGKPLTRQYVWKLIKKRCEKVGITKNVSPHTFRHTFATQLLANGADLRSVQELLGHSDISTTQIYTHVQAERLHQDYDKYFPKPDKKDKSEG